VPDHVSQQALLKGDLAHQLETQVVQRLTNGWGHAGLGAKQGVEQGLPTA
jgi:hypothetical protein